MATWPRDSTERLLAFQREVNRLFRRFFEESPRDVPPLGALTSDGPEVRVDVFERDQTLYVQVEVPGVPRDALQLSVSRDLMVVEGTKPAEERGKVQYHCMERDAGPFRQVIEIPTPINAGELEAVYRAGVLHISAPLIVEDRRGVRREVQIEDGDTNQDGGTGG